MPHKGKHKYGTVKRKGVCECGYKTKSIEKLSAHIQATNHKLVRGPRKEFFSKKG